MAAGPHANMAWIAGAALVAGCGNGTVQCGACPPPAYLNLRDTDGAPATTQVSYTGRICVEGMACEDVTAESDTVALTNPRRMNPSDLGGRTVTVTVTRSTDGVVQHGRGTLVYREGHGVCACSGVSAQVVLSAE